MKEDKQRTLTQNRALHLMFEQMATTLNEGGQYIGQVIKIDAPWNAYRVKELIWREVQKKMTGKESTTQITTKEIDEIFEVIHLALANKGIEIQFPSIETILLQQRAREYLL